MNKSLPVSIVLLMLVSATAYAYDEPPKEFRTKGDAVKGICQLQPIKEKGTENCIIIGFDDHDLKLTIYDVNPDGGFERRNQLTITSWYQEAKVSYEDILGKGIKFIRIEFEGNTGIGTLQKIVSYWGWNDSKFVPIFFETSSYYISGKYLEKLKMNYEFKINRSKQLSAILKYSYSNNNPKYKAKYNWNETLRWQTSDFSFYNLKQEEHKFHTAQNPIHKKIANARINQIKRKRSMSIVDPDLLNEIEIMQILYEKVY